MTAWKQLERETAKYFGTKRRLRGADFSQEDVEVLVDTDAWLGNRGSLAPLLIVECKYRKTHGVVTVFKDLTLGKPSTVKPIVTMSDEYLLCKLDDFVSVYCDFIEPLEPYMNIDDIVDTGYEILRSSRQVPDYLIDYRDQASDYIVKIKDERGRAILPLVCLAKANTIGKLISVSIADIVTFRKIRKAQMGLMP
jgi:hypothetical protein